MNGNIREKDEIEEGKCSPSITSIGNNIIVRLLKLNTFHSRTLATLFSSVICKNCIFINGNQEEEEDEKTTELRQTPNLNFRFVLSISSACMYN